MKELGRGKVEYEGSLDDLFENDLEKFIEYNIVDVDLVVAMDEKLKFIELCRAICHAGYVPYEDYIYSSKWLEGACLSYLKNKGLVATNKPKDRKERMQALRDNDEEKFIGAYVKEPIVGKYDWIYDLDLTSLYPSIIMTLNISPETKIGKIKNWDPEMWIKGEDRIYTIVGKDGEYEYSRKELEEVIKDGNLGVAANGVLYNQDKPGLIADILDTWFKQRVEFRKLEKKYGEAGDTEKYEFYGKRQLVQKILLNSMYGVLGLPAFRFYDIDNAEAVTISGQSVIKTTADMINLKYNKELGTTGEDYNIYVDTDSVFFSAVPILKHRYENYETMPDVEVGPIVNDIAGETQEYVNTFYNMMSKKFFNIDKHRFEIKKEFVSRAGFWVAKKRYAMWIILKNGIPMDKLDVKGLDVVRSSFPKSFQKFMKQSLIDILRGIGKDEMTQKILTFKQSLPTVSAYEIAKSSAVKELSKYAPEKGNLFQFQKGTPAHIKAAWAYNQLLKHFNCGFKYSPMRNGDKMKWVYLKQNPLGLDALAFKGADDPQEIVSLIKNYIDYDGIFESDMVNKLEDFYIALGWGKLQLKITKSDKFFSV